MGRRRGDGGPWFTRGDHAWHYLRLDPALMVILQRVAWHARFDPITGAHEGRGCTATDRTLAGLLAPGESENSATRRATRQIRTLREGGWIDVATQGRGKGSRIIRIGQRTLDELREVWEILSARNTDMGVGISREGDLENTDIGVGSNRHGCRTEGRRPEKTN